MMDSNKGDKAEPPPLYHPFILTRYGSTRYFFSQLQVLNATNIQIIFSCSFK